MSVLNFLHPFADIYNMNKTDKETMLSAVKILISLQEEMGQYYEAIAAVCKVHTEFWGSNALAKQACANLYTTLYDDIGKDHESYILHQSINGFSLNLLNKIKSNKSHVAAEPASIAEHARFLFDVELTICSSNSMPSVIGNTETFKRIHKTLERVQRNHLRLLGGLVEHHLQPAAA